MSSIKKIKYENFEKGLETVFISLMPLLGEKKFKSRIKKAIKLFTHGVDKKKKDITATEKPVQTKLAEKKVKASKAADLKKDTATTKPVKKTSVAKTTKKTGTTL